MTRYKAAAVAAIVLLALQACNGDEPKVGSFARVEVQGILNKFKPSEIRMPEVVFWTVTVARKTEQQRFILNFAGDDLNKLVYELRGETVIVTGDLVKEEIGGGKGFQPRWENVIKVKSLKGASLPKK